MRRKLNLFWAFIALGLYASVLYYVLIINVQSKTDFSAYIDYRRVIANGWLTTIGISLISIVFALFIGLLLYIMENSSIKLFNYIAIIHKNMIFGIPLLVIVIVGYYYISSTFNIRDKFWAGTLMLGLYIGAYVSDIYKGAISSIHINQWQTAKMFGFNKYHTYRYVVFPQVIMSILPPLAGQFALTIKSSALLSVLATDEFFNTIKTVQAATFRYPEGFIIVSAGYLIITIPLVWLIRYLENRLNYRRAS